MAHSSDFTNAASLEDCRTNFFALSDLNGIKWKRLCGENISTDPTEDPILLAYSECISSGVLTAWRRISNQKPGYHVQEENNRLLCFKELWIFWCGDGPDFSGLVKYNLCETEQGSWESGLSYEGRILFFKALHNAIERCLLSHGYARFGKYFVIPQKVDSNILNRKQKAISFNFFIHGESTVCASIDIRLVSSIYILNKCHITAAQAGHQSVKVILCPYGITGKLTSSGYKYSDPNMARFLNQWNNFFPHHFKRDQWIDSEYPHVVEVLVAGARMKYPISYVFVTEEDHFEAFPHYQTPAHGIYLPQTVQPASSCLLSAGLLTPPMSPNEDPNIKNRNSRSLQPDPVYLTKYDCLQKVNFSNCITSIKRFISQECFCSITSDKNDDSSTLWDFQDPSGDLKCVCHRISKKLKKKQISSTVGGYLQNGNKKSPRTEKFNFHHIAVPFHRQKSYCVPEEPFDRSSISNQNAEDTKTSYLNSNLPQLQTSVNHIKSEFLGSTPSDAFYTPTASLDPVMPTLSPQPPVPLIKEESGSHISDTCPNNGSCSSEDSSCAATLKGKISEEILSPLHASLLSMFENAKNISTMSTFTNVESTSNDKQNFISLSDEVSTDVICSINHGIEKPCLPKRQYEDKNGTQQIMTGLLYDYQHLNSPLWVSSKRLALFSEKHFESSDDHSDTENENNCDMKSVPCTPKDPYEFTDIDEVAPPDRGFRPTSESFPKEEEKFVPFIVSSPVDASPTLPVQEVTVTLNDTSSPLSSKNLCPKFIREEDLAVSLHDLENIFDTSSEDDDDNIEVNVTSAKLSSYDEFSGKIELSRMYPTPPSLEQNAVPSPFGAVSGSDYAITENEALRENNENNNNCDMIIEKMEENVFIPPLTYIFPESPEYAVVELMSVFDLKPEIIYKPSYHLPNSRVNYVSTLEDPAPVGNLQTVLLHNEEQNTFYNNENIQDFLINQSNCDSLSSSNMSFANRSITSNNSSISQPLLEIDPLVVNLLLSDSLLNIFKDINFSCCCICACNMNIKGSDAGIILPTSLIPSENNEPQYKCTCGFSSLVHRQKSYRAGLFYEDEVEIYGTDCDTIEKIFGPSDSAMVAEHSQFMQFPSDCLPDFILDILKIQCKSISSVFSLFHKSRMFRETCEASINTLDLMDGCEICFMALEEGKNTMDNPVPNKLEESFKSSCLHKWLYNSSPLPATSQEVLSILDSLKPLLQVAIHKKNTQKLWEVTYAVSGPLTWKEFHRLAPRGTEDQCEPQPIPFILAGNDTDCATLSPFSVNYWDKLHLEPHSLPRDVAYIVVAPESESVLSHIKNFFRELSCSYELHNLGKHQPITKVLRDGIMRIGKTAASKVAEEPVSDWFSYIGDGPVANKLKLYARVFKHRLAPHLSTLPLDNSIFESASSKSTDNKYNISTAFSSDSVERPSTPKFSDNDNSVDSHPVLSNTTQDFSDDEEKQPPALVIYIVEPFTFGQLDSNLYRLVTLGLLHSYADMLSSLPEATRNSINLQLLSLDSIMTAYDHDTRRSNNIKTLAFSVFSQSHNVFTHQSSVKCLTGFGPAAGQELFLSKNTNKISYPLKIYNQPYILASLKDKQTELGEMFGDGRENSGTLFCSYCLSKDKKFIITSCTNDKGEFIETNIINVGIPKRLRRKHKSVQKFGLRKLLEFIFELMCISIHPWRLIIERFGRLGQGELKTWANLLNRKSLHSYSKRLREMCGQCSISGVADVPCILSVCLVSLEPDSTLRLMSDMFTPDSRFNGGRFKNCQLNTLEDASCTHILVFPTSATTQSSQVTFHQEHIDPLSGGLGEDFFEALNDEDINNPEISDILKWTTSPHSPGNSPKQESDSQPSSPNAFKHSFSQEGTNQYTSFISDCQDEPLQLLQQPLAVGYYVSTAKTVNLPKWFWSSCPHLEHKTPVFLKSALLFHVPYVLKSPDDLLQSNPQQQLLCHPMDSSYTTDVLRYVLEGHNTLSWLALDSNYHDRRSCLPLHIQTLIQLYDNLGALL